jgi:hypothetical protein
LHKKSAAQPPHNRQQKLALALSVLALFFFTEFGPLFQVYSFYFINIAQAPSLPSKSGRPAPYHVKKSYDQIRA